MSPPAATSPPAVRSKQQAQTRADRIRAFDQELRDLEGEGVLRLGPDDRQRVAQHHAALLRDLTSRFDVDVTESQKQMTWGMRLASFLGALALCAAVFLFFRRFWGLLGTPSQVAILVAAPLAALLLTEWAARREKTLYVAGIAGLIAFGSFVLDLSMLGIIFNITPSPKAFLPWAAFGFLLAYGYGLRLLLAAGILSFAGWLSATAGAWSGMYWLSFGERPENFLLPAVVLLGLSAVPHEDRHEFPPIYRIFGLLGILLPMLVLANWGGSSYLFLKPARVEGMYQIAGFLASAAAMAWGVRRKRSEAVNVGCTFFVIFLYTKLFDWWWDWMPKYLFFLILGGIALGFLLVLRRLRSLTFERPA